VLVLGYKKEGVVGLRAETGGVEYPNKNNMVSKTAEENYNMVGRW